MLNAVLCLVFGYSLSSGPAIPPPNVTVEVNSSTSVYVVWEEIPEIDRNGIILSYQVRYQSIREGSSSESVTTNDVEVDISDLEEYTNYSISVRARTRAGFGGFSDPVMIQTFEDRKLTGSSQLLLS